MGADDVSEWQDIKTAPAWFGSNEAIIGTLNSEGRWTRLALADPAWTTESMIHRGATHWLALPKVDATDELATLHAENVALRGSVDELLAAAGYVHKVRHDDRTAYPECEDDPVEFIKRLRVEATTLRDALLDMYAGWKYIRKHYGDLSGVGWERCDIAARAALKEPAR